MTTVICSQCHRELTGWTPYGRGEYAVVLEPCTVCGREGFQAVCDCPELQQVAA